MIWKKRTTGSYGKNCFCAQEIRGARVHHSGERLVPSMQNCGDVCCRKIKTICCWSLPASRIRFRPFPTCLVMDSLRETIKSTFADCVRGWRGAVEPWKWSSGEKRNGILKSKYRVYVPKWNVIKIPCEKWYHKGETEFRQRHWEVNETRQRWFGHVKRRDQEYVGIEILEMVPHEMRRTWRHNQRWMDCVNLDMKAIGTKIYKVRTSCWIYIYTYDLFTNILTEQWQTQIISILSY